MRKIYGSRYITTYIISGLCFVLFIIFLILSIITDGSIDTIFIVLGTIFLILSILCVLKIFFLPIYHISYNEYDDVIYIKTKDYQEFEINPKDIVDINIEVIKSPTIGNLTIILNNSKIEFKKIKDIQEVKKELLKIKESQ